MTVIEAFAAGRGAIVTDHGAMAELVTPGDDARATGLRVRPNDPNALAAALHGALADRTRLARWGREARAQYASRFTPAANVAALTRIYHSAIDARRRRLPILETEGTCACN